MDLRFRRFFLIFFISGFCRVGGSRCLTFVGGGRGQSGEDDGGFDGGPVDDDDGVPAK